MEINKKQMHEQCKHREHKVYVQRRVRKFTLEISQLFCNEVVYEFVEEKGSKYLGIQNVCNLANSSPISYTFNAVR